MATVGRVASCAVTERKISLPDERYTDPSKSLRRLDQFRHFARVGAFHGPPIDR
jgi:hypothetical protein